MFSDSAPSGSMYNCFKIRLTVRHKLTGFPLKPTLNAFSSISLIENLVLTSEMDSATLFYPETTKTFLFRLFRDVWEGEESSKKVISTRARANQKSLSLTWVSAAGRARPQMVSFLNESRHDYLIFHPAKFKSLPQIFFNLHLKTGPKLAFFSAKWRQVAKS